MSARSDIEEAVAQLGLYVDAKEWAALEGLLSETVDVDYTSLFGGLKETVSGSQLVERWRKLLSPLKATQHMITNLHVTIKEDGSAACAADVVATHVRPNSMGDPLWVVGGRYDLALKQVGQRWKISAIKLTTYWTSGNPQILNL